MIEPQTKRGLEFTSNDSVEITIATNAGACFGVVRAIKLGYQAVKRSQEQDSPLYSFGPLIHNPHVVNELRDKGVETISESSAALGGTVLVRSTESSVKQRPI